MKSTLKQSQEAVAKKDDKKYKLKPATKQAFYIKRLPGRTRRSESEVKPSYKELAKASKSAWKESKAAEKSTRSTRGRKF